MEPVRFGIIGCGVIGRMHVKRAADTDAANIVAVADVNEEAAHAVASAHGVPSVYNNAGKLLDDRSIEAVVVALPTGIRGGIARDAFRQGKHVLVEKPAAMNVEELQSLIDVQGDRKGACCSCRMMTMASNPVIRDFIATGALGRLRVLRIRVNVPGGGPPKNPMPAWRLKRAANGGGIFVNWGTYDLDWLLSVTGWQVQPQRVLARSWRVPEVFHHHAAPGSDAEAHIAALITCEHDIAITYERGEAVAAVGDAHWQIIGDRGSLRTKMTAGEKQVLFDKADTNEGVVTEVIWEGEDSHEDEHGGPVRDFAEAIRENREPLTSLDRAVLMQRIFDATYRSCETGQCVEV